MLDSPPPGTLKAHPMNQLKSSLRLSIAVCGLRSVLAVPAAFAADTTPPAPPTEVRAVAFRTGARLGWPKSTSSDVAGYNVYRRVAGTTPSTRINSAALVTELTYDNAGLKAGTQYVFLVTAVDGSGNESKPSVLSNSIIAKNPTPGPTAYRAANCPSPTITVPAGGDLQAAFDKAGAGDVIRINPGVFSEHTYRLTDKQGTADEPIWICGSRSTILTRGGFDKEQTSPLRVSGASHVILTGFSITHSQQGLMITRSDHVTVSDLKVADIGQEGIHLYQGTTDSRVTNNQIERTGEDDLSTGEGIYIGTSQRRWDVVMGSASTPDKSDRNVLTDNLIIDAGAEGIEAKEGTSDGIIEGNTVEGHQPGSNAHGWVLVTGDGWLVRENSGTGAVRNGFRSMQWTTWGKNNVYVRNTGDVHAEYGLQVHTVDLMYPAGTVVTCDHDFSNYSASSWTNFKNCQR
jgi:parallel beta helix pectate lyase-like protein/fibronectin type III domain protein